MFTWPSLHPREREKDSGFFFQQLAILIMIYLKGLFALAWPVSHSHTSYFLFQNKFSVQSGSSFLLFIHSHSLLSFSPSIQHTYLHFSYVFTSEIVFPLLLSHFNTTQTLTICPNLSIKNQYKIPS